MSRGIQYHPQLQTLIRESREKAPYYNQLYKSLPENEAVALQKLPYVEHSAYWEAYTKDSGQVLTARQSDGIIMRTGGTTSTPKFTHYSQAELQRTASLLARGLIQAGIRAGDRVGNLFYAGDLYGSFLLHILSLIYLPIPAIQVPIGGLMAPEQTAKLIVTCEVTSLLSTVTSLIRLADYCRPMNQRFDSVTSVMFGGEPIFADQQDTIAGLFPNATIRSCIYGSMDAGVIATSAGNDDLREHRILNEAVLAEIITESGPTDLSNTPGMLVVTNLIRELMPVLHYPTGDRAEWVDREAGVFRLLGRASSAVRLGPVSLDVSHARQIAHQALVDLPLNGFQLHVTREDGKDALEVMIAAHPMQPVEATQSVLERLYTERPMLKQHVDLGLIAPVKVTFTEECGLQQNASSGKVAEVVDLRHMQEKPAPVALDRKEHVLEMVAQRLVSKPTELVEVARY